MIEGVPSRTAFGATDFRERVAAIGEPLLSAFTPGAIDAVLRDAGFRTRDDRALGPGGSGHVMIART